MIWPTRDNQTEGSESKEVNEAHPDRQKRKIVHDERQVRKPARRLEDKVY